MTQPSIFLSHNKNDKSFARRLGQELRNAGARVWIDEAEIKLGDSLVRKIAEGIDTCDYLGVILSPDSVASEWVRREVELATNREIRGKHVVVLPLLYRRCEIPTFLSDKRYADFTTRDKFLSSLNQIKKRLDLPLTPSSIRPDPPTDDLLHQLRTSLGIARRLVEHVLDSADHSAEVTDKFIKVSAHLVRTELIVSSFRLMQAYSHGQYPVSIEPNLPVLEMVGEMVKHFGRVSSPRIRIQLDTTCRPIAGFDARLLQVAVSNLLDNAVKYSYSNSVITAACSEDTDSVRISVRNHGLSISPEEIELIFKYGYRCHNAMNVAGEGSGVGLYLARQIMMSHGGSIGFRDTDGFNEFTLEWPRQYSPDAA